MADTETVDETNTAAQPVENDTTTQTTNDDKPKSEEPDWKATSRKWEKQSKENHAKYTELEGKISALAKALLGEDTDETPSIDDLTAGQAKAVAEARQAKTELALYKAGNKHGADIDALMDSRTFMKELESLDPADSDFASAVDEAIKDAVESNPRFKVPAADSGKPKAASGGRPLDGSSNKKPKSEAEIAAMTDAEYKVYRREVMGLRDI